MLRDAALAWMRSSVIDPRLVQDFERHFDHATQQGINCFLALGPGLTKDAKPRLLHCFCGELFIFELTLSQSRRYKLTPGQVMWGTCRGTTEIAPLEESAVTVSDLHIDMADDLPLDHPIIAEMTFETNGMPIGPCVVRLDYEVPGLRNTVCWHYFEHGIGTGGRIRCQYLPVKKPGVATMQNPGPLALFFRLCSLPDPKVVENRQPISNIVGGLVSPID
jgi:hypothetical protein